MASTREIVFNVLRLLLQLTAEGLFVAALVSANWSIISVSNSYISSANIGPVQVCESFVWDSSSSCAYSVSSNCDNQGSSIGSLNCALRLVVFCLLCLTVLLAFLAIVFILISLCAPGNCVLHTGTGLSIATGTVAIVAFAIWIYFQNSVFNYLSPSLGGGFYMCVIGSALCYISALFTICTGRQRRMAQVPIVMIPGVTMGNGRGNTTVVVLPQSHQQQMQYQQPPPPQHYGYTPNSPGPYPHPQPVQYVGLPPLELSPMASMQPNAPDYTQNFDPYTGAPLQQAHAHAQYGAPPHMPATYPPPAAPMSNTSSSSSTHQAGASRFDPFTGAPIQAAYTSNGDGDASASAPTYGDFSSAPPPAYLEEGKGASQC